MADHKGLCHCGAIGYDGVETAGRVTRREDRWSPVTDFPK